MSKSLYCLSGRLGITDGMNTAGADSVSEHASGNPGGSPSWIVDISHLLSEQLGKQMSMTATYRVKGLHLSLRNKDDLNDNNYGLAIGGGVEWYCPTKHRVDAIQYAREYLRDLNAGLRSDDQNPFSPYVDMKSYKGLRFHWYAQSEIDAAMEDETSVLPGDDFTLSNILEFYNRAKGGTPILEGRASDGSMGFCIMEYQNRRQ